MPAVSDDEVTESNIPAGKSGFLTYMLDFSAVFLARYADTAGIIFTLR